MLNYVLRQNTRLSTCSRIMEASTSKEPIPSFQDIDSDSAESESNEEADALLAAGQSFLRSCRVPRPDHEWVRVADAAFTDDEVDEMVHVLRERGLFAFIKLYVEERAIPIKLLLLPFGVMLVSHWIQSEQETERG